MNVFLNELSLIESNYDHAKKMMTDLLVLYKEAQNKGFTGLKMTREIFSASLAPNYTLTNWTNDKTVEVDIKRLFFALAKYPYVEDFTDFGYEFSYDGKPVKGLGAAYLNDSLSISMDSSEKWRTYYVNINVSCMDDEGIINQTSEPVCHSSKLEHLDNHTVWITNKKKESIPNGTLLWLKRKELFPHLVFSSKVENQIRPLNTSNPQFINVTKRLFELENYCSTWMYGSFDLAAMSSKVTVESESRVQQYKNEMTFLFQDGKERLCEFHSRFTPGAGRIHFSPDEGNKIVFVGYIGQKIE